MKKLMYRIVLRTRGRGNAENPLATQSFASFQFADGSSLSWEEFLARGSSVQENSRRWRYGGGRLQMHEQSSERRAA